MPHKPNKYKDKQQKQIMQTPITPHNTRSWNDIIDEDESQESLNNSESDNHSDPDSEESQNTQINTKQNETHKENEDTLDQESTTDSEASVTSLLNYPLDIVIQHHEQDTTNTENIRDTKHISFITKPITSTTQSEYEKIMFEKYDTPVDFIITTSKTQETIEILDQILPKPIVKFNPDTQHFKCTTLTHESFTKLVKLLTETQINYFSYSKPINKPVKYVLKYLPPEYSNQYIHTELLNQGIAANVSRLLTTKNQQKIPTNVLIITFNKIYEEKIKNVTKINNIKVKTYPYIRHAIPQCHRCQKFWHSSLLCHMTARCVKCGASHPNSKCTAQECKCANCGGPHPANYRQCPHYTLAKAKARPPETQEQLKTNNYQHIDDNHDNKPNEQEKQTPLNNTKIQTTQKQEVNNPKNIPENDKTPQKPINKPEENKTPPKTAHTCTQNKDTQTTTPKEIHKITPTTADKSTETNITHQSTTTEYYGNTPYPNHQSPTTNHTADNHNTTPLEYHYLDKIINFLQLLQSLDLNNIKYQLVQLQKILHTSLHPTDNSYTIHQLIEQTRN